MGCKTEPDEQFNTSPCLIVEVLSGSTARKDRTEKLTAYRLIPSLQEYVLCSQDTPIVEVYQRRNDWQWYSRGEKVYLASIQFTLVIDELYAFLGLGLAGND